mmetsp:Transcript_27780/g.62797  ORF Transcript_27780/g.62797 Transcript_27780/m.62797 type:complete len:136 (-) Transcript_27780:87-494(-)
MGAKCCAGSDAKEGQADTLSRPAMSPLDEETVKPPLAPAKATGAAKQEFGITIKKTPGGPRLGVDVDLSDGVCLLIDKVNDGLVSEWNRANPDKEVRRCDKVVSVNGKRGDAQALAEACKTDDVLEMIIQPASAD